MKAAISTRKIRYIQVFVCKQRHTVEATEVLRFIGYKRERG